MPQTCFELNCFNLGSSSGLVRKAVAPASLPLLWPTPGLHVLGFGSVPEDSEVSYLSSGVFNGKNKPLYSFLVLKMTKDLFSGQGRIIPRLLGGQTLEGHREGPKWRKQILSLRLG